VTEANDPDCVAELKCLVTPTEIHTLPSNLPQSMEAPKEARGEQSCDKPAGSPYPRIPLFHAFQRSTWDFPFAGNLNCGAMRRQMRAVRHDVETLGCVVREEASLRGGRIRANGAQPLSYSCWYSHRPRSR
jgi:hypothetical protein